MSEEIPGIRAEAVSAFFAEHVPGGHVPLAFSLKVTSKSTLVALVGLASAGLIAVTAGGVRSTAYAW